MNLGGPYFSEATLYVGDLHENTSEETLLRKFSCAGFILSVRVCRNFTTGRSLGYAYINFLNSSDAELALDTMNFDFIDGRPVRIMWAQRDPSLRRSGVGNVFIKNLDKNIDDKIMYDTFSAFGNILSCKVSQDENGVSKGYGFIHFETEQQANTSIEKVNGTLLNGQKVYVAKFIPKRQRESAERVNWFGNLYVKNFGEDWDDNKLKEIFEPFGKITSLRVITTDDGKSKGFGFVAFETQEAAEAAVDAMNRRKLPNGKTLYVSRAQKKAERQQELTRNFEKFKKRIRKSFVGRYLHVEYLDNVISKRRLFNEFKDFGEITSIEIVNQNYDPFKVFGLVCFKKAESAFLAIRELNAMYFGYKPLCVSYANIPV